MSDGDDRRWPPCQDTGVIIRGGPSDVCCAISLRDAQLNSEPFCTVCSTTVEHITTYFTAQRGWVMCMCHTGALTGHVACAHERKLQFSSLSVHLSKYPLSVSLASFSLFFFLFCSHIYFLPAKTFSVCLPAEPNKRRTAIKHPCNKQDVHVFFSFFFRNVSLSSTSCLLGCKIMRHYRSWRKAFHISEMSLGFW